MTHPTSFAIQQSLLNIANEGTWRVYEGVHLDHLKARLRSDFHRSYVRLCCSGTFGIELAVRSLKLPSDAEVLLAGYDYPGNFRAIQNTGASIGLYDVKPGGFVASVEELQRSVGPRTRAIVVSHLHGTLAPMQAIGDWAKLNDLYVIEDVCQEPGAQISRNAMVPGLALDQHDSYQPAGSFGDVSVLSFGGSKPLSAGRGGAVLTDDPHLAQRMTVFCEQGNDAFALSELQAAVLVPQLVHLQDDSLKRRRSASELISGLSKLEWLELETQNTTFNLPTYYKVGIRLKPKSLEAACVQRFVNVSMESGGFMKSLRERMASFLASKGVAIGPGFLGFGKRSASRCRHPDSLANSQAASERTMVLHHSHLLDPQSGESTVKHVLTAFEALHTEMFP
jgi:perosamine synthetase